MMKPCLLLIALMTASLSGAAPQASRTARLADEVRATEASFARTMAARDHAAFAAHLASEAVFFGANDVLRGRTAVAAGWKRFFDGPTPPFSWEPAQVEVLDSGTLALSSGPVRDPSGKHFANFQSIWRQESPGVWRIVFDKGERVCDCGK